METLRIAYADFWPEWPDENFVLPILSKHFDVIEDQSNPDVVFHSVFGGNKEIQQYNCKKIWFTGENYRPISNTDFTISFDPHSATNFRLPLWQVYLLMRPEYKERLFNRHHHDSFDRFCSFTVSNPSNFMRNSAFQQLNNYKFVHSYGRYMNNDNSLQKLSGKYWRDSKTEFFKNNPHKFSLAYENTPKSYYCTEKLMDAFLGAAIPVYWGDPTVVDDWNLDAFINASKTPNIVDAIKIVDNDPVEFERYYSAPVFKDYQKEKLLENLANFETWLIETCKK